MSVLRESYDLWADDIDLVKVRTRPADLEIRNLCRRFVEMSAEERERLRKSLTDEELSLVWSFSNRCAALALRDRDFSFLSDGLIAYSLLTYDRMDYRDLDVTDLVYVARKIGCDLAAEVASAASLAEPGIRDMLLNRYRVLSERKDLGALITEVQTDYGPGLITKLIDAYHPSRHLDQGIFSLAELVMKEGYKPSSLNIATSLSAIWFRNAGDSQLKRILESKLGCATLRGSLYPGVRPEFELQGLLVWLLEVPDPSDAVALENKARGERESIVVVPVAEGPLFCLVVAEAMRDGVSSHETLQSMTRFRAPIRSILRNLNQNI